MFLKNVKKRIIFVRTGTGTLMDNGYVPVLVFRLLFAESLP
jgi:hypothetical protein